MATRVGLNAVARAALVARAVLILCGWAVSAHVFALGLGELDMQSFLNEPLRAEVEVLDVRDLTVDDIRIRLAEGDDFDRLGVERSYFLTSIQFELDVDPANGTGVIRLSTDQAVLEPYLDLIIEARWPSGRLLREYTILVDPPAFRQDVVTVSASERVAENEAAASSGAASRATRPPETTPARPPVAIRESTLASGEMPQRKFSAGTNETPTAGSRYLVKRDETLWQIAYKGRPQGISVQQAMLEIQRLNPEAFINGNINQVKAGYIIYLPSAGEVSSDDLAQALEEVRAQNRQWQASRSTPGVTAAATLRVSADAPDAPAGSTDTPDRAGESSTASAPDTAAATSGTRSDERAGDSAGSGDAVASARLAQQLDAMASRLDTLEQIVSLKDEQIATLEQALREAREAAASAAAAPVMTAPAQPASGPISPAPESEPRDDPGAPPAGIPWTVLGGGLLLLLLLVFLFVRWRSSASQSEALPELGRSPRQGDDVFAGVSLKKEALAEPEEELLSAEEPQPLDALAEDAAEDIDTELEGGDSLGRGGSRGYGERKHDDYSDEGAGGDALAEADIYIAYGRYLQAIELLDSAIEGDPENSAYRLKLIELYVDMGEDDNAAEQTELLRRHGDSRAIARAEALINGGGGSGDARGSGVIDYNREGLDDLVAEAVSDQPADGYLDEEAHTYAPVAVDELATDELAASEPASLEPELTEPEFTEHDFAEPEFPEPEFAEPEFTEPEFTEPETTEPETTEPETTEPETTEPETTEPEFAEPEFAEPARQSPAALEEEPVLDIEPEVPSFALPGSEPDADLQPEFPAMDSLDEAEEELSIEFDHLEIEEDVGGGRSLADELDELDLIQPDEELDLSEALLDDDFPVTEPGPEAGEDLLIADDADQMATKLDLARAYLDMGDEDGARVILDEVASAGSGDQQQEARELLTRIG